MREAQTSTNLFVHYHVAGNYYIFNREPPDVDLAPSPAPPPHCTVGPFPQGAAVTGVGERSEGPRGWSGRPSKQHLGPVPHHLGLLNIMNMGSQHPSPNLEKCATSSTKFSQKLSHHVLPKVLVLKAQGRRTDSASL